MGKPISIGFTFQTQSGPIPLSELDTNFTTVYNAVNDFATYGNYLVDTSGAPNVITVTTPVNTTFGYTAGVPIQVQIANTTTSTSVSINVNGLGPKSVLNSDGTNPAAGNLISGQILQLTYDGAAFRLLGSSGSVGTGVFGVGSAATPSITFTGRTNTGIYSSAANAVDIATNGLQRVDVGSTGTVTVNAATSGASFSVSGAANANTLVVSGSSTSGQSFGISLAAGTTSADYAALFRNQSGSATFMEIFGDGHGTLGPSSSLGLSWTAAGNVTVAAPSSGVAFTTNGDNGGGSYGLTVNSGSTAGDRGAIINGGVAAGDPAMLIFNKAQTVSVAQFNADGSAVLGNPTGGTIAGQGSVNLQALAINAQPVYAGIPQNSQSGAYQLVLADANKHIYKPSGAATITIPANGTVAFPIGTAVTIVNDGTAASLTITTDTMLWSPSGSTTSTRTLAQFAEVTILKVAATRWYLTGTGIS